MGQTGLAPAIPSRRGGPAEEIGFKLDQFDVLVEDADRALVRVSGRFAAPTPVRVRPPSLVVVRDGTSRACPALPDAAALAAPAGIRGPRWRGTYVVERADVGSATFALSVHGVSHPLPAPTPSPPLDRPLPLARDPELGRTIVRLQHELKVTRRRVGELQVALQHERRLREAAEAAAREHAARREEAARTARDAQTRLAAVREGRAAAEAAAADARRRMEALQAERERLNRRLEELDGARLGLEASVEAERRAVARARERLARAADDLSGLRRELTGLAATGVSAEYVEVLQCQLREHRRVRARLNAELAAARARGQQAEARLAEAGVRPRLLRPVASPATG